MKSRDQACVCEPLARLEQREIGHRCDRDHRLVKFGLGHRRLQRCIAAIGPAEDRHSFGISDPRQPNSAPPRDVGHRRPPVSLSRSRSPTLPRSRPIREIGLDHRIAARREELGSQSKPQSSRALGPPCGITTTGRFFAVPPRRKRQIGGDLGFPPRAGSRDGPDLGKLCARQAPAVTGAISRRAGRASLCPDK